MRCGLVEGRNDLVAAEIADIADFDGEVVARLPLDVERVVEGVGQLVGAVVDAERDGLAERRSRCCVGIGQVVVEVRGLGIVGRRAEATCRRGSRDCPSASVGRLGRSESTVATAGGNVVLVEGLRAGQLEAFTNGSCWLTPKGPPVTVPMA